jgi:hypothetical protein
VLATPPLVETLLETPPLLETPLLETLKRDSRLRVVTLPLVTLPLVTLPLVTLPLVTPPVEAPQLETPLPVEPLPPVALLSKPREARRPLPQVAPTLRSLIPRRRIKCRYLTTEATRTVKARGLFNRGC